MKADRHAGRERSALRGAALALCLLAASCAWTGPARAQYFGQNKVQYKQFHFQVISSPHFDVYFYEGGDSLALRVLDLAEKANLKLKVDLGHVLERKVPIILYNSHNDFQQTNVILEGISASTGGFTEVLRNRVVIPFPGSYDELRHVLVHELTHAYMFDMLYGGGIGNAITKRGYFDIPLWFAEGLAEWESLGWDRNAEMFVRDGTITGYLPPLEYGEGYLVYKEGQVAMRFLVDRFGPDRLRDLLQKMKFHRSFNRAFEASLGTSTMHFNQEMTEWLRRTYWPLVREESGPETFARRLTDHRHDRSSLNLGAAISPAGDRIAYFTDRKQFTDVFLMSAIDGQVLKRLVRGERNVSFEALPSFRTSLTWSPDGKKVAVIGQSQTRDVLYVMDVDKGDIVRRVKLDLDQVSYPAWNPKKDELALVGMKDGRSDLYLLAPDGTLRRLTDDAWDERQPSWTPDGKSIVFSSDRGHPVVLAPERHKGGFGDYGIYQIDVETGAIHRVLDTSGDDSDPVWSPDGRRLAFVSDRGGSQNLYLYDTTDSSFVQLTDLVGGVFSLSWARETDRLVFSALNEGGWDIFESKVALGEDSVVTRLKRERRTSVRDAIAMAEPAPMAAVPPMSGGLGALAPTWPDTVVAPQTLLAERPTHGDDPKDPKAPPDSVLYSGGHAGAISVKGQWPNPNPHVDSLPPVGNVAVIDSSRAAQPFALPDSIMKQKPAAYRPQFAADFAGGGFQYNSGFGFAGSTQLSISDFLGDRRLQVGADIFSSSLRQMNLLALYTYLPKRTDYGIGAYHFNNYFFSTVTALGERFSQPRYFNDETFGVLATASYPFDRFHRIDFALTQMLVNRSFFDISQEGLTSQISGQERRLVTAPSATLVHDNTVFGYSGPVSGTRSFVNFSPALRVFDNSMQYETVILDYRRYFNLGADYQVAVRGMSAASFGRDAQAFQIGGATTVRGYDDFALVGTRIAFTNFEIRFPFVNGLGLVGPIPLGFFNLRGVAFADNAVALNDFHSFRWTYVGPDGKRRLEDLHFSFGGGVRSAIAFLIVKLDVAWKTNFHETSQPVWHFSLGPEF
jgi:Tol biopolymer transport system component